MKGLIVAGFCVIAVIALLAGIVSLIGWRLPVAHTASRSVLLHKTPSEVYTVIRDFAAAPAWRKDVKRVELQPPVDGGVRFREEGKNGTVNYQLEEDVPNQRMVTRITDTDLGYSGKWTYALTPEGEGTRLTITEDGEVPNIAFRFMSRYVFGHTATIDAYFASLSKRFGEQSN